MSKLRDYSQDGQGRKNKIKSWPNFFHCIMCKFLSLLLFFFNSSSSQCTAVRFKHCFLIFYQQNSQNILNKSQKLVMFSAQNDWKTPKLKSARLFKQAYGCQIRHWKGKIPRSTIDPKKSLFKSILYFFSNLGCQIFF